MPAFRGLSAIRCFGIFPVFRVPPALLPIYDPNNFGVRGGNDDVRVMEIRVRETYGGGVWQCCAEAPVELVVRICWKAACQRCERLVECADGREWPSWFEIAPPQLVGDGTTRRRPWKR
jgi:hypothetical protein